MKRLLVVALAVLVLAGCDESRVVSTEPADEVWEPELHYVFEQELADGRTVQCVWASVWSGYGAAGGISCDWESAK